MSYKYPDHYILFYCFCSYMDDSQLNEFKKIIGKWKTINIREKTLVNNLTSFVPLETLKDNPLRWQDIWIYNYILYDMPRKKRLLWKYAKEVIGPGEEAFNKLIKEIGFNL